MIVDLPRTRPAPATRASTGHPVWRLTGQALRGHLRRPMSTFFILVFPLSFLAVVLAIVGNPDTGDGVPVAQYLVSPFAVFGAAQAAFCLLAVDLATLREEGVLLRLRGTPVPAWAVLTARTAAALALSVAALGLLTAVGVVGYGVAPVWSKTPALLLTFVLGTACFAALGLAVAALTRTVLAAQTLTQGLLIPLAFVSDVFIVGADLPRWLDLAGSVLPLKHFAQAMAETFTPGAGTGLSFGHLGVLAAWTVVGALVARLRFGWQPRGARQAGRAAPGAAAMPDLRLSAPQRAARPSPATLVTGQLGYALSGLRHDLLSVFFAVVFPVLLLVLFPSVFGDGEVRGLTLAQYLLPGMAAYAVAVTGWVNLPEQVVAARANGVLKRLAGTPLPQRWYLTGRLASVLVVSVATAVLLGAVAVALLDVRLDAGRLPAAALALLLGVLCFAALGLALVAALRSARSVTAITLGTLLPLSFVSDVFPVGDAALPGWLALIGDLFPLRHLSAALLAATRPGLDGAGFAWAHLAVLAAWTVAALLVLAARPLTSRD
ncbi:ABC transporter permease [Micromonospora halophytica]|uniref:Transport permease protein n=1 Tax=Micromonospora halophytica TaxID=47864 RepID=A0A1C5I887_9ACTN|nr:ABC transporter permease [Micromonospora halophytica]SCG54071.1 ABC-type multidrug transport system, permease component [Micromonospora halophytica]